MEPIPVQRSHLEALASRLAWSRVLPGLVLVAVGATQPFAVITGDDGAEERVSLTLTAVVDRADDLENGGVARVFAVLLIAAVIGLGLRAVSAVGGRTEWARRLTMGSAVLVFALGVATVAAVAAAVPKGDDADAAVALSVQGPVPLLIGALAVAYAASRAAEPMEMLERSQHR